MFAVNVQAEDIKKEEAKPILGPAVKPEPKQEVKQDVKKPVDEPVSKWTMVDYDDEDSVFPGVQ